MMKIIKGKKYDTETALKVAEWDNGLGRSDHHAIYETLYKKRTGEFFLFGEGGGLTGYSEAVGNAFTWGEKILLRNGWRLILTAKSMKIYSAMLVMIAAEKLSL